jgi:hypothetical protein
MASEFRITRDQTPCEKLTTYMRIINELALIYLNSLNNKNEAENLDDKNRKELYEILDKIETTTKDIFSSLDAKNDDNYVKYKEGKKMIVHKAVKGWIDQSEKNKNLVNKIINLYELSAYELSEVIMTHICRYCVSKIRELLSSSAAIDISGLEVKNLKTIYNDAETVNHLKVVLAILLNIRDILRGNAKDLRLLHKYITLELERNILPTIKVDKNLDLTVEEVSELQIYKHGTIQSQQNESEEKDTRYKISHFIPYNNNPAIKNRQFSQYVIPAQEIVKLYASGISGTSTDRISKFIQYAENKLNEFIKALIKYEDKKDTLEGKNAKRLNIYKEIGDTLENVYKQFMSSWKHANTSIQKVAEALKDPINEITAIMQENKIDTYPMLDIESTMQIEQIQKNKQNILETLFSNYLAGAISKDDILRNVLVYVVIRYAHTMYCDLMTLMLKNKQTLAFSRTIRSIYKYDDLDVLEHEYPEGKEKLNRIAEILASILIAYVLQFFLKHYDKNTLNKDKSTFSIRSYLDFMLVNIESFQQTLFDIVTVTILKSINSSTSDTILVHNYMRMDNMMYLADIIANSWPLFAPFFASSTANVWTVYREFENETFVKHDESLGIIDDKIINTLEKDSNDNPFIVFSHIPVLWPWNRKSKGKRQLDTEEKGLLPQIQAMYKEKIKDTKERPSKSALGDTDNKSPKEIQSIRLEELSEIIQHIVEGYNTLIDLRLVKINIFYQMNLVYEAYKQLKDNIAKHLEEGTTIKGLEQLKGNDRMLEEDLIHPLFTKSTMPERKKSSEEHNFNINYVDFAKDIFRYINTIITRLFFICGLAMQSESGYYIVEQGIVRRTPNKRNFTNWSKSLLINDSDYLRAAYSLIKGLSFASSKHHGKMKENSDIVKWVAKMLKSETEKLIPIVRELTKLSKQIQQKLEE